MKDSTHNAATVDFRKLRQFIKSLTPKERKKLKEFRKNVWWWRSTAKRHPIDFKTDNSLAFNYELVRRVKRKLRLQRFPDVAGLCRITLPALDETPPEQLPFRAAQDKAVKEKGWLPLTMEWNLKLTNAPLQEAFLDFIQQARKREGIPDPRRNAGIRRIPQPWRWLELMDIDDLKIHRLAEKDKTTLRTARKRAKNKWLIFFKAITEAKQFNATASEGDTGFANEEDSGFTDEKNTGFEDFILSASPAKTYYKLWHGWPTEIVNK